MPCSINYCAGLDGINGKYIPDGTMTLGNANTAGRAMSENNCEYVKKYYGVPACIGRLVTYKGRSGIIAEDGGNYIKVNFNDQPGITFNIHPTDENLVYKEKP